MAILAFQKPDKVLMLETNASFGKFEFRPLEPGYGITIGNALRRILLSSLEGYAISSVKIEGVEHEFASIPGVLEDVTNIILNLKKVRFKRTIEDPEGFEQESVTVSIAKKEVFNAADIGKEIGGGFEVLNPELEICHLDPGASMQIVLTINKGRGYVPADEHQTSEDLNVIAIDSIYTPIRNVKYTVDNFRVEQKTDFEKLVVEITTDGSVHPKEALKESARILIQHFMLFSDDKIATETVEFDENEEFDEEALHMRQLLKSHLTEMDLSVRALNCLKSAEVATLGELVHYNKNDLLKFRNFGKKSLTELDDLLDRLNLSFGMEIAKYKLDKD